MEFNESWPDSCSKVGYAARIGNLECLKRLIEEKCPVDVADNRGWKPLHEAAAAAPCTNCLEELLKHKGTDINWQTHENETALLLACKRRRGDAANDFVTLLLQAGADPNIPDNESDTPLLEALANENEYIVEKLVEAGADVNTTDFSGWSALHMAATKQNPAFVQFLLKNGANIEVRDECGMTPVFSAAQHGCEKSLEALLIHAKENKGNIAYVVNMGAEDWATPLMIAAQQGFLQCVKSLLDFGADPNLKTSDNATALHMAVQANKNVCLELLLQKMHLKPLIQAWHPSTFNYSGMICPMHLAIEWENHAALKVLLEAGFSPDSLNDCDDLLPDGFIPSQIRCETALSYACYKKDSVSLAMLLKAGASPSPPVEIAYHPAVRALTMGNIDALNILIESGTDINYQRKELPSNEVFLCALMTNQNVIKLLLHYGCDPNLCFKNQFDLFQRCAARYIKRENTSLREFANMMMNFLIVSTPVQNSFIALSHSLNENISDILDELSQPSSLLHICKIKIRQLLYSVHGVQMSAAVSLLNLPQRLQHLVACPMI